MYGDTDVVRALARAMRQQADEIRAEARVLATGAADVPWTGVAADAFRSVAARQAAALGAAAQAHDRAADALERHAREVDHLKGLIAAAERRVHAAISALSGAAVEVGPARVAHWLATFVPPAPGHVGWLHVRLPRWLP